MLGCCWGVALSCLNVNNNYDNANDLESISLRFKKESEFSGCLAIGNSCMHVWK